MSVRGARAARGSTAPARAPSRRRRERPSLKSVPAKSSAGRRRLPSRTRLLIVPLIAALLAGIVWINVAKLTVTAESGRVLEQARAVQSDNVRLQGQLEQRNSQVIDDAQRRLGMVPARNDRIVHLTAPAPTRP